MKMKDDLRTKLAMLGLGEVLGQRAILALGQDAFETIKSNPYTLMSIEGISFKRADAIADILGVNKDDPRRITALIKYAFQSASSLGHTYLPMFMLEKEVTKLSVKITKEALHDILSKMLAENDIIEEFDGYYLTSMHFMESFVAERITALTKSVERPTITFDAQETTLLESFAALDEFQQKAVGGILSPPSQDGQSSIISVLTGGPGTGKTHTTNLICSILTNAGITPTLCAPTGKAAKRLTDLTGRPAKTIHRLLGASFGSWKHNAYNKLRASWVIVDESSMLDLHLAYRLLSALHTTTPVLFIGDVDQLAPVGPGNFFKDLINSRIVPVFRLRKNHRQGKGSMIATNALTINNGGMQLSFNSDDMVFVETSNPIEMRGKIIPLFDELRKEFDADDIQVLTPQKATTIGVEELNKLLRFHINKTASPKRPICVGDRVMQMCNDYSLGIFNGFVGKVISEDTKYFFIKFFDSDTNGNDDDLNASDSITPYPKSEASSLSLCYASTVHKFQGSEFPAGIIIVSSSHTWMLTRNLLYTAITRAKKKCVILGERMALKSAIVNTRESVRYTGLLKRLVKNVHTT